MKRFTETEKWENPWFFGLPTHLKCLWLYICDKADCAGVWAPNWKVASMFVGKTVTSADLAHLGDRVGILTDGKVMVRPFVGFQYGKLSEECRAHIPIFRKIESHRVSNGYPMAIHSHLEPEPEQEQDKEKDKETEALKSNKARGTLEEVVSFCREVELPASDGESCFHKWEANGWKNGGSVILDWRSTIRSWKAAGYMPSQKAQGRGKATATQPTHLPGDDQL